MNLRKGILCLVWLFAAQLLSAQATTVYTEAQLAYKRGVDFFNQGIFGLAQQEFHTATELLRPVNEPAYEELKTDARLYYAKCAVRLDQPEAEVLVVDILREQAPSPVASQAALEIGDYYFNSKDYTKALTYYDMAPSGTGASREEITFKKGYSYFVTKKFAQAKSQFAGIKENTRGEWYHPANYYYGCCVFFEGRYDDAIKAFSRAEQSPKYKKYVPYYLTQIYFAQKQYDRVISYGSAKARDNSLRNQAEINQLIGQAYFEKKDYKNALPYLEFGATNGATMTPGNFYALGYTQYQNGYYKQAIENFEQLTKADSLLGQNGLYHLGDCYLRTNNKFAARNAFGQAASMNLDPSVREDALFNYAKLSVELKYDRDALNALQGIPASSRYFEEAQTLMGTIFLNTRDYDRAVATLEGISNRNRKLNEAYQQVCYLRGLQLYQNNMKDEARRYFNKSLDFPLDRRTAALCSFWMGVIAHESKEYVISKGHLSSFLTQAPSYRDLPEESSMMMGQYVQGYNFMKLNDFNNALSNFRSAVEGLKKERARIVSDQIKKGVLGDATLRAGDCHFKKNQYKDALAYYNEAIAQQFDGFEYALYQKAIIRGLQGVPLDKIIALEDLVNKYPKSRYADEALFQLGVTYQDIGQLGQAQAPLKRLVSEYRDRSTLVNQALLRLGLISFNQGSTSSAISYYKQVFSNNPENSEAKDALAALEEIYVRQLNRPDEYFNFLETIPGYNVSTASRDSVTFESAEIQYNNARYAQAIEGLNNYLAKYPNGRYVLPAHYLRAESYSANAINRYDLALKDYIKVVEKGPSKYYARAAEKGAYVAVALKDQARAFEMARKWEEAAASDNARLDAQLLVLQTAYAVRNTAAVSEYTGKVTRSRLASGEQIATAYYYQGKLAFDEGNFSIANTALKNVTVQSTADIMAESYHLLAQILYRQRQYDAAEQMISDANKASAGYDDWIARNLILLSDVYADQGDKNSAAAALEAILENYRGQDQTILATAREKYNKLNQSAPPKAPGTKGLDFLDLDEGGN